MKNLIHKKNTISEFDFLWESNNMLTSGTSIKIDTLVWPGINESHIEYMFNPINEFINK